VKLFAGYLGQSLLFPAAAFRSALRLFAIVSCTVVLAACADTESQSLTQDDGPEGPGGRGRTTEVPVVTASAQVKTMPILLDAVGTAEAISTVQIRAQVTGQLQEILFSPGEDVHKGQPLFVLDPRPLQAAVRQAEAVLAKDTAQARDAAAERGRAEDLFKRGLIPRAQYETQAATAAALEATLAADRAQLDQARLNLQYARIRAPIEGRTGALMAHVGDLVRANDTNPLVTINQISPIYVSFAVPARYLIDIRRYAGRSPLVVTATGPRPPNGGMQATGETRATGGGADATRPVSEPDSQGAVTFIDNAVDPATATIKLKATFPNTDRDLWPGLFVQVSLQLASEPDAVVVPAEAVQTSQQGQYVYVVQPDRTVELRHIELNRQQGGEAVIASGLKGGEEVVTEGQLRLTPGAHVTATKRSVENDS
jgi:multidrug efflux system membrane fusion protein